MYFFFLIYYFVGVLISVLQEHKMLVGKKIAGKKIENILILFNIVDKKRIEVVCNMTNCLAFYFFLGGGVVCLFSTGCP